METYFDKIIKRAFGVQSLLTAEWFANLREWNRWYLNDTPFHKKWVWTGDKYAMYKMSRLGLVKLICQTKADLQMNEKVEIVIPETYRVDFDNILDDNNFWVKMNQAVELSQAHGYYGIIVDKDDAENILLSYVSATGVFPITARNGEIEECVFLTSFYEDNEEIMRLEGHFLDESGNYVIKNAFLKKSKSIALDDFISVDVAQYGMTEELSTGSPIKKFTILSPNVVNNIIPSIPLGIPCYANALWDIKGADTIYDSYINEFILGKKRIIYSAEVSKPSQDGNEVPNFDPNEIGYLRVDFKNPDKPFMEEINMEIRSTEHKIALSDVLNVISIKCGLGLGYFSFEGHSGLKTATEVVSEHSELFRAVKKDEQILKKVIRDLTEAIFDLKGWIFNYDEFEIIFDDSIIEDKKQNRDRMFQEVNLKIRTPESYYKEIYGYTEEQMKDVIPADFGKTLEERLGLSRVFGDGGMQ